jgi:hypothetical protein
MGNFASVGASYTKDESDDKYPLKTNVYSKQEDNIKYATFATKTDLNNAATTATNTFQPKGNYALVGASYTKEEDDGKFATFATKTDLNTFQPKGNYALVGASYTKAEDDAKFATFATKTDLNTAATTATNTFQQKGNYALVGASYTKAENDSIFQTKAATTSLVNTNTLNDLKTRTLWCADGEVCQVPTGKAGITSDKLHFTSNWRSRTDTVGHAEISNHPSNPYNALIIAGPKVTATGKRNVQLYDNVYVHEKLNVADKLTIEGNTINNINGGEAGRVHISGNERLYLLNKDGVIIGREWGGNGNLQVQGKLNTGAAGISDTMMGPYRIQFYNKGDRCLDVGGAWGGAQNGLWDCNAGVDNQQLFWWNPVTGQIINVASGKCLNASDSAWYWNNCNKHQDQQFIKWESNIRSISKHNCLDIGNGNKNAGCGGGNDNQRVRFSPL